MLEDYLTQKNYDTQLTQQLVQGFMQGFDIGYQGPENRHSLSTNIPLRVGTKTELWNKIMKVVAAERVAGPYNFQDLPFEHYIQSPVGLVPKAGNKTRLIFHLSFDFGAEEGDKSLNYHTPKHLTSVQYRDLDHAIRGCLQLLAKEGDNNTLYYSKRDASHAFRVLPILPGQRKYLIMMAYHPITGQKKYFIDTCLPFGASINCALYQKFSDALRQCIHHQLSG